MSPQAAWRRQCWRAAAAWLLVAAIWLPTRYADDVISNELAYLLLPALMALPFIGVWALTETLALLLAWPRGGRYRAPGTLLRLRLAALLVALILAAAALWYGQWHDERAQRQWLEQQREKLPQPAAPG